MKKCLSFALSLILLTSLAHLSRAVESDENFISLTRRSTPISQLPSNISVLNETQIRQSGARNVADLLDLMTSVDLSRAGNPTSLTTTRIRAVPGSAQSQILIDDQPISGISVQQVDISLIPIDNIERIEIVRGASSVLYGANTIGGAVNIITKKRSTNSSYVELGAERRSYDTEIYTQRAGLSKDNWDATLTASKYRTAGFQQNSDSDNTTFSATSGYSFSNGGRVSGDVNRITQESGDPQGTSVNINNWDGKREKTPIDSTARVFQDKTEARVRLDLPLSNEVSFQTLFFASRLDYKTQSSFPYDKREKVAGNDTRLLFANGWTFGAAYERDTLLEHTYETDYHVTNTAGYIQKIWELDKLIITPAARYDYHSEFGGIVNPRFTAVYNATDWWVISTNAARSYRAPSFFDLYYQNLPSFARNADLEPETAWTYDLGNQFRLGTHETFKVTGFFTRIKDQIVGSTEYNATTNPVADKKINRDRSEISGAEIELQGKDIPAFSGQLNHSFGYTYQRALGKTATTNYNHLKLTPRHLGNAQLTWSKSGWALHQTWRYVAKQFLSDSYKGQKIPGYLLWNARISKQINQAEVYAGVDNLTNRHYSESGFGTTLYPQPDRTYLAGLTVKFGS